MITQNLIRTEATTWSAPVNIVGVGSKKVRFTLVSNVSISCAIRVLGSDVLTGNIATLLELAAFDYSPVQGFLTTPFIDTADPGSLLTVSLVSLTDLPPGSVVTTWVEWE